MKNTIIIILVSAIINAFISYSMATKVGNICGDKALSIFSVDHTVLSVYEKDAKFLNDETQSKILGD